MRRGCAELARIATYRPGFPRLRGEVVEEGLRGKVVEEGLRGKVVEEGLRGKGVEGPRGFCPPSRRILHLSHLTRPAPVHIRDDRTGLISGDDTLGLTS